MVCNTPFRFLTFSTLFGFSRYQNCPYVRSTEEQNWTRVHAIGYLFGMSRGTDSEISERWEISEIKIIIQIITELVTFDRAITEKEVSYFIILNSHFILFNSHFLSDLFF